MTSKTFEEAIRRGRNRSIKDQLVTYDDDDDDYDDNWISKNINYVLREIWMFHEGECQGVLCFGMWRNVASYTGINAEGDLLPSPSEFKR